MDRWTLQRLCVRELTRSCCWLWSCLEGSLNARAPLESRESASQRIHVQQGCWPEKRPSDLFPLPNIRAGERVSLQPLPFKTAAYRDSTRPVLNRAPDQNLVSKQENEMEEREQINGPLLACCWSNWRRRGRRRWWVATQVEDIIRLY